MKIRFIVILFAFLTFPRLNGQTTSELFNMVENGSASAMNILGLRYLNGYGVKTSKDKAYHLFLMASEKKSPSGFYNVGMCNFNGIGTPINKENGVKYLLAAAKMGHELAMDELIKYYKEKDDVKSLSLVRKARDSRYYDDSTSMVQYITAIDGSVDKLLYDILPIFNDFTLTDENGDGVINKNEYCNFKFSVENIGRDNNINGFIRLFSKDKKCFLGETRVNILPNVRKEISIDLLTDNVNFTGKEDIVLFFNDKGIDREVCKVEGDFKSYNGGIIIENVYVGSGSVINRMEPFKFNFSIKNNTPFSMKNIIVSLSASDGFFQTYGSKNTLLPTIKPYKETEFTNEFIYNGEYDNSSANLKIEVKEKNGRVIASKEFIFAINQKKENYRVAVNSYENDNRIFLENSGSFIDVDIPVLDVDNDSTFAVIISNEHYKRFPKVDFSINDGLLFKEYCAKTMGIPQNNIKYYENATYGEMMMAIDHIKNLISAYDGECKILFYYSGHGTNNGKEKFFIPIDGHSTIEGTWCNVNDLYFQLGKVKTHPSLIFVDACFLGNNREGDSESNDRGFRVVNNNSVPEGNLIILSASSNNETAYAIEDSKHGLFTYFLLKKIKIERGDIKIDNLMDFLTKEVYKYSTINKETRQTPTITLGSDMNINLNSIKL